MLNTLYFQKLQNQQMSAEFDSHSFPMVRTFKNQYETENTKSTEHKNCPKDIFSLHIVCQKQDEARISVVMFLLDFRLVSCHHHLHNNCC